MASTLKQTSCPQCNITQLLGRQIVTVHCCVPAHSHLCIEIHSVERVANLVCFQGYFHFLRAGNSQHGASTCFLCYARVTLSLNKRACYTAQVSCMLDCMQGGRPCNTFVVKRCQGHGRSVCSEVVGFFLCVLVELFNHQPGEDDGNAEANL